MRGKRLLLFDIDGTLMSSGGAGRKALSRACQQLWGVDHAMDGVGCAGRIDPHIFRDAVVNVGIFSPESINGGMSALVDCYLDLLPQTLRESPSVVLDGVWETLQWLQQRSDAVIGLATGNFRSGAYLELSRVGLQDFFALGGFGEDGMSRSEVLVRAKQRGETLLGSPLSPDQVLVIGDTLLDIAAAKEAGIPIAAVASGADTYEQLREMQPDLLWRDMREGLRWFQESGRG